MKRLAACLMALAAAALPAGACNLDLAHRGWTVADYVEAVQPCLADAPDGYVFDAGMEADFLRRVNGERASAGLPPLTLRPELVDTARIHSLDMAYNHFFGHEGPDGRQPFQRVAAFDRTAVVQYTAENVAMVEVVNGRWNIERNGVDRLHMNLMNSPPHKANILNPEVSSVAMGVVRTKSGVWITQVFVELGGTLQTPMPVRLPPGATITRRMKLRDWNFDYFEAKTGDGTLKTLDGMIPNSLTGDFELMARGSKAGEEPGLTYFIHLPGPAVTVGG